VERWQQANDAFAFLFEAHPGDTAAQIALRFCLSHPAVSTVIPGMLTPAQVNENAAASQLGVLPADELRRAAAAYAATEFFVRRTARATA
jgi:aryl-alcohol dehydrogenase-like predicted oxidoreductase